MGVELSADGAALLIAYLDAVLDETTRVNLTAIHDREDAVVRHLLDSLSVVPFWNDRIGGEPPATLLDLGTGGGFPAVPLAVVWPRTRVLACDSTGKKIAAIARMLERVGGPKNVEPLHVRVEQMPGLMPELRGKVDLVVARAVGRTDAVVRSAAKVLRSGARVVSMKGPEPPKDELDDAASAARAMRFIVERPYLVSVPRLLARTLLVYRKP
jgi:16S rRNA (guanine527-N7)-methyltransferase